MATVNIGDELMKRILTHTKNMSEPELRLNLQDAAREIIRIIAVMRDVAEFPAYSPATEYILPAAGREFCRIFDIYGRVDGNPQIRVNFPEEWKNHYAISDDAETGSWLPPEEVVERLQQAPYRIFIEYVMTVRLDEDMFPRSIITQYYEAIILFALMKIPRVYLADERRNYAQEYYDAIAMVQKRVSSGGIYWVRTPPYWGDAATRSASLGTGSYGLPL